ncbi:MAG: phage shock protein operon transcriptional activator [Gammaproteobacteria bacterium]
MTQDQDRLLGQSPAILRVLEDVSRVAPLDKPVLVVGERGTGKELIAARVHYLSNRWSGQFLKLNCAAISDSLLETELFGHEAGAFTGATRAHQGRFERADGGTLFLDELANTSLRVQEQILRVIEYGEFERVGGSRTLRTHVRLVAATNEDLPALARAGRFRHDLLDRLAFDVITLPPLRAREEDMLLLAEHFAIQMTQSLGRAMFAGFSASARRALTAHSWPGNVRELKNVVERAVYRADPDAVIEAITFDPFDSPFRPVAASGTTPPMSSGSAASAPNDGNPPAAAIDWPIDFRATLEAQELALLQAALAHARFHQRQAAQLLGLTYDQLRGYLKKYNLTRGTTIERER